MTNVSAIVLAAGLSARMGDTNKLFLNVRGKPLIAHVIERVYRSNAHEVILVTSEISRDQIGTLDTGDLRVILNPDYKKGMTTSIQVGVENASVRSIGYMICLGDQPLISVETYDSIIESYAKSFIKNKKTIWLPVFEGKAGHPVVFSSFYKTRILKHTEAEGCKSIVWGHREHLVKGEVDDVGILKDVDTHEDYDRLLMLIDRK